MATGTPSNLLKYNIIHTKISDNHGEAGLCDVKSNAELEI